MIGITGSFKLDQWKDKKTGENRSKPVIRVDRLELLGGRKDIEESGFQNSASQAATNDEEIPF